MDKNIPTGKNGSLLNQYVFDIYREWYEKVGRNASKRWDFYFDFLFDVDSSTLPFFLEEG